MEYLNELEHLLTVYIEEDKARKAKFNEYDKLKTIYYELLEYLKCDYMTLKEEKEEIAKLFRMIYPNDIYLLKFYEIIETLNDDKDSRIKFSQLRKDIYTDYKKMVEEMETIKLQIERNKYMVASANRVKLCFRHNLPINQNKYDIPNIKDIISYYQLSGRISNKKEVLLINEIELYNRRTASLDGNSLEKNYSNRIYGEIPNILNAGFYLYRSNEEDEIEIPENRKKTIDNFIETIFNLIMTIPNDEIIKAVKEYYDYYKLDYNEYQYMIIKLLDKFFFELRTYYEMLIDKEIYKNRENRTSIISGYYKILDKYLILFGYYDKLNKLLTMEEIALEDVNEEFLGSDSKELIYAHTLGIPMKAKMLNDMKNIPYEYYDRVLRLLTEYKNNTISVKEVKSIKIKDLPTYIELKDDQIRIVIKHIKDNIYVILGVFAKKDDNDPTRYNIIVKRYLPDISTENKLNEERTLSTSFDEELDKLVNKKRRKGNR